MILARHGFRTFNLHPLLRLAIEYAKSNSWAVPTGKYLAIENHYYYQMDAIGLFTYSPVLYIHRTHGSANFALINRKNPGTFQATIHNSPSYTQRGGFTGNATNAYINYNWVPSTHGGGLFLQNDARVAMFTPSNIAAGRMFGAISAAGRFTYNPRNASDQAALNANDDTAAVATSITDSSGFHVVGRTSSTLKRGFRNDLIFLDTVANTSTGLPAVSMVGLAHNNNGSIEQFTARRMDLFSPYQGTQIDRTNYFTIWTDYITKLAA